MKTILGNWKMHGSRQFVTELLHTLITEGSNLSNVQIGVLPPAVFLSDVSHILSSSPIAWGAQNVSQYEQGAFTGEISANMLLEYGCRYVLVGHSERRSLFGENDGTIAAKFWRAQSSDLLPVLCVGESLQEREEGRTEDVIAQQVAAVFKQADNNLLKRPIMVAYEPVWAIGTGKTATPDLAQAIHVTIKELLQQFLPPGQAVSVLYGGSMNAANAQALLRMPDIDGGLIGGASLKAEDFIKIACIANEA